MSYRDDLQAAHARIEAQQRELDIVREQLAEALAKIEAYEKEPSPKRRKRPSTNPTRPASVFFSRPVTFVPFYYLWRRAISASYARIPTKTVPPVSGSLVVLALWYVAVWPFANLLWTPLYSIALTVVVLPWVAAVCVVLNFALAPVLLLLGYKFGNTSRKRTPSQTGWFVGSPSDDEARMFVWVVLSVTMPFLLPIFIPLLDSD